MIRIPATEEMYMSLLSLFGEISRTLLGGLSAVFAALVFWGVKQKKKTFFPALMRILSTFWRTRQSIFTVLVTADGVHVRIAMERRRNWMRKHNGSSLANPSEQREQYESMLSMSACWNVHPNESRVLRAKTVSGWLHDFLSPFFRGFQRKRLEISYHSTAFSKHVLLSRHDSSASVVIEKKTLKLMTCPFVVLKQICGRQ